MKKHALRWKNLMIGVCAVVLFVCSVLSFTLIGRKQSTLSVSATDWQATSKNGKVEVYQLAPNTGWLMESYVIKTANGKLIVIDGGADGSDSTHGEALTAGAYMPAALRAIAGVGADGYFEVEAWFISHAHKDHFSELAKTLNAYTSSSNFVINNFYFDIPDYGGTYHESNDDWAKYGGWLKAGFDNYATVNGITTSGSYFDDLNSATINEAAVAKGLNINIDGVRFEILQTYSATDGADINSDSIVFRMWVNNTSFLFFNDTGKVGANRLINTYGTTMASDYVQMAHHGQDATTAEQYEQMGIKAGQGQKYLWCPPFWVWTDVANRDIDENYKQVNGNTDMVANDNNFVACLYDAYPATLASYDDWLACIDSQKVASVKYFETDFAIVGSQVRTRDPEGLRFIVQVTDEAVAQYGENSTFGILLIPEAMDDTQWLKFTQTTDITDATALTNTNAIRIDAKALWSDALCKEYGFNEELYDVFSCAVVSGETLSIEQFVNTPFTAVGFIIPANGSDVVYTERFYRSLGYVAEVEKLRSGYEENELVEKYASAAVWSLSVNDGKTLQTTEKIAPEFLLAGMPASMASQVVNVTYTSSDTSVVQVVDGKIQATGNGTATITATATRIDGGTNAEITSKTTSVTAYINQAEFDTTLQKNQQATSEDVVFTLNTQGYGFTVLDSDGAALSTSAYAYDATAKTLTFDADYINTLSVGAHTFTLQMDDLIQKSYVFSIAAYGEVNGDYLAFPDIVQSASNFDAVPTNKISDYLTTNPASNVYVNSTYVNAAIVTGDAISGHSLKLTTTDDYTTNYGVVLTYNFDFEANVQYKVSMKMTYKGKTDSSANSAIVLRFTDNASLNANATGLNITAGGRASVPNTWGTAEIDSQENGVITWHGYVTATSADAKLTICFSDAANVGSIVIDDFVITKETADAPTFDTTLHKAQVGASEDVAFTFDSTGHNFTVAIDGTTVSKSNYVYDATAKTLTFPATYLNTLTVGTRSVDVTIIGCENHATTYSAAINVYGDADSEHLAFPDQLNTATNFDYITTSDYVTTTATQGYMLQRYSTAEIVDGDLVITTAGNGVTASWNRFADFYFDFEEEVEYTIYMKFKYTMPSDATTGHLVLRFSDTLGAGYSSTYATSSANNGTTQTWTTTLKRPSGAEQALWFQTANAAGTWTVTFEEIRITKTGTTATSFDDTKQKAQESTTADIAFAFDSAGHYFSIVDADGATVSKSNYAYDLANKTLTFKAAYLNTLSRGAHLYKVNVSCSVDTHAAQYAINLVPYGTDTDHLAFTNIYAVNNFELMSGVGDYVSTSVANPVHTPHIDGTDSSAWASETALMTNGFDGQYLQVKTTSAAVEAESAQGGSTWNNVLGFNLGFAANSTYHVTMQIKYTLPTEAVAAGKAGTLILRFNDDASTNAWAINVGQHVQATTGWAGSSGFSYDPTTGILTIDAYVTTGSDATNILYLTTASDAIGIWTLQVDNICITQVSS